MGKEKWVLSIREEVVQRHFAVDEAGILRACKSGGGHEHELHAFPGAGGAAEDFQFRLEVFVVVLVDGVGLAGELHFADVDDSVAPVDDEVDLRAFRTVVIWRVSPEIRFRIDAGNPQRVLDPFDVLHAESFERKGTNVKKIFQMAS